jgi:hypothetical protein
MQRNNRSAYVRLAAAALASTGLAMLAGCGVAASTPPVKDNTPITLQGQVLAGKNYMVGATINIYVTQPTGTVSNGAYTGTAKLLQTVTADATGSWTAQGLSCSSPDQLYVTAAAGVPYPSQQSGTTLSNNPNSLMLTAIGDCSILSSASSTANITSIVTNEASTIAAVWALRSFISLSGTTVNITSDATNYAGTNGVGVPGNYAGLAHAFLNANSLSPYKLGGFNQYVGDVDATQTNLGLVPVQELNSLSYVQYLCTIGNDGTSASNFNYCTTLYGLATPPGGKAPTNSLQAMLNIANNPSYNAAAILAFAQTPVPFTGQTGAQEGTDGVYFPALTGFGTAGTNDWSVAIYYLTPFGETSTGQGSIYPINLALDANDNVYVANPTGSTSTAGNVIALTSNGNSLWTSATDTTKLIDPRGIAADQFGHVWTVNGTSTSGFVQEINASSGATIQQIPSSSTSLYAVAVDSLGNVWYDANSTVGQNLHELLRNGTTYTEAVFPVPPMSPTQTLLQLRPDSNNNIWVAGYSTTTQSAAVYFPNTGTAAAPTYTSGLKIAALPSGSSAFGIATDASGNAYSVTNILGATPGEIYKTTVTGTGASAVLTPAVVAASPVTSATFGSRYLDIDGVGNIWFMDADSGTDLYQYIPSTATTTPFYPCYNAGTTGSSQTCTTGISTRLDVSVDSTGSIWIGSYGNTGGGRIVQIIGLAAPTVPLKALGKIGVTP